MKLVSKNTKSTLVSAVACASSWVGEKQGSRASQQIRSERTNTDQKEGQSRRLKGEDTDQGVSLQIKAKGAPRRNAVENTGTSAPCVPSDCNLQGNKFRANPNPHRVAQCGSLQGCLGLHWG
jgi:hypothetical protein